MTHEAAPPDRRPRDARTDALLRHLFDTVPRRSRQAYQTRRASGLGQPFEPAFNIGRLVIEHRAPDRARRAKRKLWTPGAGNN